MPPTALGQDAPHRADRVLEMHRVSKRFGTTQALAGVNLDLARGEVHGLMGENGAGKSTLIKIMTGLYSADSGSLLIDGTFVEIDSPADAQTYGIAAIYQEPLLFPDLTVAENIYMGHTDRGHVVRSNDLYRDAEAILSELDVNLEPRALASTLTVGEQQAVEIAKALSQDVRVLIMDEPTAALSAHEAERLFRQVAHLRDAGVAILFISHRLGEVFTIADRISVFRDGQHISTRAISDTSEDLVVSEMVGRELGTFFARSPRQVGGTELKVTNLGRDGVFADVSFELRRGEVLGLAGLVGAGRTDIALALFGIAPATSGTIEIRGTEVVIDCPRVALDNGVAYLSEDRRKFGLSLPQSVTANISLPSLSRYANSLGLIDTFSESGTASAFCDQLSIHTPDLATPVGDLSGGNQQKTMLAKWLNADPSILILDEPTRGIDVGAKSEVHRLVDSLAKEGMSVLLISSDLPEVLAMCDRIVVMRSGRVAATFEADETDQEQVMTVAVGSSV